MSARIPVKATDHDFRVVDSTQDDEGMHPEQCDRCGIEGIRYLSAPYVMCFPQENMECVDDDEDYSLPMF